MEPKPKPIIVIVGPTASGKSALAMHLAEKFGGEIICADSRTIYKDMDIGTAKPSLDDQKSVPHWGLDLVTPDQKFSAAEFKRYADVVTKNIISRKKLPMIVGGSGLYVDGFLYDFEFGSKADEGLRGELDKLSMLQLQQRAESIGLNKLDINFENRRHLSRAIERGGMVVQERKLPSNVLLVGLRVPNDILHARIEQRVGTMFNNGLIEEVKLLINQYGKDAPGLLAPGYRAVIQLLEHKINIEEAQAIFIRNDKRLAKRQNTWFKRNKDIVWVENEHESEILITNFLQEFDTI